MQVPIELVHILSALLFGAGYISAGILVELARQSDDDGVRRTALALGGWFESFLVLPFGVLAGLSGIVLTALLGFPFTAQWVVISTLLYLVVLGLALTVWRERGMRIDAALGAGNDDEVTALLRDTRYVVLARAENVAVFVIVVYMVVRPL